MVFESPQEWKLNIKPQDIFDIDSQDFTDYETLGNYLSQTIQTKSDLITVLHFSDLHKKFTHLFFELSKINSTNLISWWDDTKNELKKTKQRIEFEKEEWWDLIAAHNQKKENIQVNFDYYKFNRTWDRWIFSEKKQIPMTVEAQKEYLDELITNWYFDMDDYNWRSKRIDDLIWSMAKTARQWNIIIYCKYIIIQAFKKNKLSDICLQKMIEIMLNRNEYSEDLLVFLKNIHEYPELINRIMKCLNKFFLENKRTEIIWINKHYPEDLKWIDSNNTREMIEKWLL